MEQEHLQDGKIFWIQPTLTTLILLFKTMGTDRAIILLFTEKIFLFCFSSQALIPITTDQAMIQIKLIQPTKKKSLNTFMILLLTSIPPWENRTMLMFRGKIQEGQRAGKSMLVLFPIMLQM